MNPWLILGVIIALAGSWYAGDRYGHAQEKRADIISTQNTKLDYDKKLKTAQDSKEAAEHAYSDLKDQTEASRETDKAAIKDASDRAAAAIAGGLRHAQRCSNGSVGAMPGNSKPLAGDAGGTATEFYLLPNESPGRLRDRYAEADNYLSLYRACRTRLQDAITKSRAPRTLAPVAH